MRSVRARFARAPLLTLKINATIQEELGPVVFSPLVSNYSQQVEVRGSFFPGKAEIGKTTRRDQLID